MPFTNSLFNNLHRIRALQLIDTAEAFQLNPKELFAEVIDIDSVRKQQCTPTWDHTMIMIRRLVEAEPDMPLALDFGKRFTISSYGPLGIFVSSMENLRSVLDFADEVAVLAGVKFPTVITTDGVTATCELRLARWDLSSAIEPFVAESLAVSYVLTARLLVGDEFSLKRMDFSHKPPPYRAELEAVLRCPVRFNQSRNQSLFPESLLYKAFTTRNPHVADEGIRLCRDLLKSMRRSDTLADQVRVELNQAPGHYPDRAAMAARFHLEPRTFSRRLENDGLSYKALVTEAKCNLAKKLLRESTSSTAEIAAKLGFSDEANFRRAFKSWTGFSPAEYRKNPR